MPIKKLFAKNRADLWLNLLICALLIVLLAQCGVFLAEFVKNGRANGDIPFEMQMLSTSTKDSRLNIDDSLFQPTLIAVASDGDIRAVVNSEAVVQEMYTDVSPCLHNGLMGECVPIPDSHWMDAVSGENYVYVQYPWEFPHQIVFAFAAAKAESEGQIRQADTYVGIREALLLPDESGQITHLLVRGASGAYMFAVDAEADMSLFTHYPQAYPDVFYRGEMSISDKDAAFFVADKIAARDIYVSEIGVSALLANREHLDSLLRLLTYNPDKLRYHTETDGTFVYVESHGVLRMDARTLRYSAAEQGGIPLSQIVGRGASGDIYTYLRAASHIVWRLSDMDPLYTGGDAGLYLRSVSSRDGEITLYFSFCSDNIEIYRSGRNTGLHITFRGDKIVQIVHHITVVRRGLDEHKLILQSWYKDQLAPDAPASMRPVYRMEEGSISMSAEWLAEVRPQEEGGGR